MHKITNTYLNVRIGEASTSAPCREYLAPSTTVEVVAAVTGTMIDGNNIWFRDARDNYYWSGGFEGSSFSERLIYHLREERLEHFMSREDIAFLTPERGVQGIGWGMEGEQCYISIFYSGAAPEQLPKFITITMDEVAQRLPVKVFSTTPFAIHSVLQPSDVVKNGLPLTDANGSVNTGSIGYFVKRKNDLGTFAVTCYHVARSHLDAFDTQVPAGQNLKVFQNADGSLVGNIIDGLIGDDVDAALIALEPDVVPNLLIPQIGQLDPHPRDITPLDLENRLPVFMFGGESNLQHGRCMNIMKRAIINYGFESKVMENLIVVQNEGRAISKGGDSGAWVVDEHNAAVGMVIGGGDAFTLVIPISRILSRFKVSIAHS